MISEKEVRKNMLSELQKSEFTPRAKQVARTILDSLGISKFIDDTGDFIETLDCKVAGLVSAKEAGEIIDEELLKIYDLLTDIVLDNENDIEFLNALFF